MTTGAAFRRAATIGAAALAFAAARGGGGCSPCGGGLARAAGDPGKTRIQIIVVAPPQSRALLEPEIAALLSADPRIVWHYEDDTTPAASRPHTGDLPRIRVDARAEERIVITTYPREGDPNVRSIDAAALTPVTVEIVAQTVRETAQALAVATLPPPPVSPPATAAWQAGFGVTTRRFFEWRPSGDTGTMSYGIGGTLNRLGRGSTIRPLASVAVEWSRLSNLTAPTLDIVAARVSGGIVWSPMEDFHVAGSIGVGGDLLIVDDQNAQLNGGTFNTSAATRSLALAARGQLALAYDLPAPSIAGHRQVLSVVAAGLVDVEASTVLELFPFGNRSATNRVQPGAMIGAALRF